MKFIKSNPVLVGVITSIMMILGITACNNSDTSGKTSTTTESGSDTSLANNTTNSPVATKRKGKVTTATTNSNSTVKMQKDNMGFYNATETAPAFPGGQSSLENYITNNIEYPQEAIDNNAEGVVNVKFTIDENGNVGNAKVSGNKLGYGLEDAAINVVSKMPKWSPGKIKGRNVKAWYTLPIVYQLEAS